MTLAICGIWLGLVIGAMLTGGSYRACATGERPTVTVHSATLCED